MALTRDDIGSVLGPVDEALAAEIMKSDANLSDLAAAQAWLANDER